MWGSDSDAAQVCAPRHLTFLLEATVLVVLRNSWRKGPQTIWTMVRAICGFLGTAAARRSCANAPTSIDEALFLEPTGPAAPVTALHACSSSTNNFFFLLLLSFLQRRVDGTVRNTTSSVGEHRELKAKEVSGKAPRLRQRGAHQKRTSVLQHRAPRNKSLANLLDTMLCI